METAQSDKYREFVITGVETPEANTAVLEALEGRVAFVHSEYSEFFNKRTQQSLGDIIIFGLRENQLEGLSLVIGELLSEYDLRFERY